MSLGLRAHAGEGAGVESVWAVVRDLGVQRIAHGVKAVDDNELLDHIRRRGIAVDMCPVSNLKLGLVETLSEHPIRELFNQDLKVTVSSDDPLFFLTDVSNELCLLRDHLDFGLQDLRKITLNAVGASFVPPSAKSRLQAKVNNAYDDYES